LQTAIYLLDDTGKNALCIPASSAPCTILFNSAITL